MGSLTWFVLCAVAVAILVYIGIYHPGSSMRCSHCGAQLTKVAMVCPQCKHRLYK